MGATMLMCAREHRCTGECGHLEKKEGVAGYEWYDQYERNVVQSLGR